MTEAGSATTPISRSQPPPAPPLPPSRTVLQRIIAPLSFNIGARPHGSHSTQSSSASPRHVATGRVYKQLPSQTTAHRTGIPIAALDLNKDKTRAILAGQEILKTVQVIDGKTIEDFNLRSAINSTAAYGPRPDAANHRREFLPAKDVRWSHGPNYDSIIATAALNGRIALYDVNRINSSRVELAWIHDHTGQVNKLDFDPFGGYLLLSGSQDKTVNIWDIRNPKAVLKKPTINVRHPVRDLKWSPSDVGSFALCTESGIVQRWDLRMPSQALLSINAHEKACYTIDWHPDGRHLVSGGLDKYVRVWDFKSENRRQKPAFQLRTPQGVMNLGWRPACWSSESTGTGTWQCTQLATGYTEDDPRVHVWDLRRPLIPFREIDRYNSRPTDLVWASNDFLWTVGYEGMFTQTDVRYAAHVHEELPPCAMDFLPDGSFVTFTENLGSRSDLPLNDAAAGFLKIPQERLSGPSDGVASRSFSEDETEDDHYSSSARRRQSKVTSSRSAKSQGNTPPTMDGFPSVLSLDQSVLRRKDLFNNEQMGTLSSITGVATERDIVNFMTANFAQPSTIADRKREPRLILEQLEAAFLRNAEVCDHVSLHRMAQSWRILSAVVVAELKAWADKNREERQEAKAKSKAPTVRVNDHDLRRFEPQDNQDSGSRPSTTSSKLKTNLFKGVMQSELGQERDSTSNMTTPLAMPLPDSPYSKHGEAHYLSLNELIEPIAPLPPSLVNSHSTATAASKALQHNNNTDDTDSTQSSPERLRQPETSYRQHKRSATDLSAKASDHIDHSRKPASRVARRDSSPTSHIVSPRPLLTQEDRRAAMRDYRAQTRPLFTLEAPILGPQYGDRSRHDSTDSFQMFSPSTDSSSKGPSFGESFDSAVMPPAPRQSSEEWQKVRSDDYDSTPQSGSSGRLRPDQSHHGNTSNGKDSVDFALDSLPNFSLGLDGTFESKVNPIQAKVPAPVQSWEAEQLDHMRAPKQGTTAASSVSDGVFHFEQVQAMSKVKMHTSNPIRSMLPQGNASTTKSMAEQDFSVRDQNLASAEYVYSDFKPIKFTTYEPKLPFAWSALPIVCHIIAFDVSEGIASGLFSVHLLMHLHPFLFNQAFRAPLKSSFPAPDSLAERLMRPDLSHRVIEGLFANHLAYLRRMSLHEAMAELRLMCVEFDYPALYNSGQSDQPVGSSLKQDQFQLQVACNTCFTLMPTGAVRCSNCRRIRDACPVCLQISTASIDNGRGEAAKLVGSSKLWTFCQTCGHGAHVDCMANWLLEPTSDGECPTIGCGCDCGPGMLRQQRLSHQVAEAANNEIIRGARGGPAVTKRDPMKVSPSPAVDRTRDTLRNADLREGVTQNGDDTSRRSVNVNGRGSSRGVTTNLNRSVSRGGRESFSNRRVRLVTPGEEQDEPSQTLP